MTIATHDDIARLFPGIQDHTAVEILHANATVTELEAASLLLQNADDGLVDVKREHGDRINRLLAILGHSEIRPPDDEND